MSEYVQKFQQLDQTGQQEVLDFMEFLLEKKNRRQPRVNEQYRERIQQVSVWSEEDIKPIEEARVPFEQWRPTQW